MLQATRQVEDDPREAARSNVFLAATIVASGIPSAVRLRNISVCGALIEGEQLPSSGAAVRLTRGHLEASCEIAWANGDYRGIRFDGPVDVQAWVRRVGHCGQLDVDHKLALLRRRGRSNPAELLAHDRCGSDNLSAISADLAGLCEELAGSARMTVDFGEQLVRLETIAQRLRRIAAVGDQG